MNTVKYKEKKNFINRLKYAEQNIVCICVDVYRIDESDDYDKTYKVLSTLKNKKLKINNILTEKYKDLLKNSDFEQDYWSRTATDIYKMGHDSIRLMKWICFHDRSFYEHVNYFDMLGSVCNHLKEISKR